MTVRFGALLAFVAATVIGLAAVATPTLAAEKKVTLNPTSGIVGTVVEAKLSGAPPNDPITVIFKIPGDPVLATGTTDANGEATFTFTIPYALSGTYPVFFTDFKCSCQVAADFTVIVGHRTPTPTATPTTPPTATPTATTTPPPPTSTPTATPTPKVPVAGTTRPLTPGGPNVGVLGLGFLVVLTVLAWFAATRRGPGSPALATVHPGDEPDSSTDLDLETLASLRRPLAARAEPARAVRDRGTLARTLESVTGAASAVARLFRRK